MATTITHRNTADIETTATYDVYRIDNLRTGARYQFAILGGPALRRVFEKSTEPRRIVATVAR
jgi:hypothetical protein